MNIHTMGQLSATVLQTLYKEFALTQKSLLITWGIEPTTIADIKAYKSQSHSVSTAQVF